MKFYEEAIQRAESIPAADPIPLFCAVGLMCLGNICSDVSADAPHHAGRPDFRTAYRLENMDTRCLSGENNGYPRYFNNEIRPEGPAINRPDRKVGIDQQLEMSAKGAALLRKYFGSFERFAIRKGMAGKFLCVNLHVVWSTKKRQRFIQKQWHNRLKAYLGSIAKAINAKLLEANAEPDHIHLYIAMPSTISIAELVNACKSNSTRWIRQSIPNQRYFAWQEGYAAFSVSRSQERAVIEYIRNQHEHHKKGGFQQELLELLRRHGIDFDIQYVFD